MKTHASPVIAALVLAAAAAPLRADDTPKPTQIDPATGLPKGPGTAGQLDPATGLPKGAQPALDPAFKAAQDAQTAVQKLIADGDYKQALKECVKFHATLKGNHTLAPLAADWAELGRRYPDAREALVGIRNRDAEVFSKGGGYSLLFSELRAINAALGDDEATYLTFQEIENHDPELAKQCYGDVEGILIKKGKYARCLQYIGDPQARFESIRDRFVMETGLELRQAAIMEDARKRAAAGAIGHAFRLPPLRQPSLAQRATNNFVDQILVLKQVLAGAGQKTEAERILQQAREAADDPRLGSGAVESGLEAPAAHSAPEANKGLNTAGAEDNAAHLIAIGWGLWQARKYDDAAGKFQRATELEPKNADAWNGLGWVKFNSDHASEAEPAFQEAVKPAPEHPAALNGLGQLYLSQGKYDQAEAFLVKAAPQASAAWFGLARLYLLEGNFAQAERWAQNIVDSGQADEVAQKMLQAAKDKKLSEGLRLMITPHVAKSPAKEL